MPSTQPTSRIGRAWRSIWWLLDATRRTLLNLLLLVVLGVLLWALWQGFSGPPALKEKTALLIDLSGRLVEQFSGTSLGDSALQRVRGTSQEGQTRLRDVLQALEAAAKDDKITHAVLVLDAFSSAGLPKLREVASAIERFKAAGKPVIAWGDGYDQRQYFLAAHASEVWLHRWARSLSKAMADTAATTRSCSSESASVPTSSAPASSRTPTSPSQPAARRQRRWSPTPPCWARCGPPGQVPWKRRAGCRAAA
jgi:hypothetical protein